MITFRYFSSEKLIHILVTYGTSEKELIEIRLSFTQIRKKKYYMPYIITNIWKTKTTYTSSFAESCSAVALGKALIFLTADLRLTNVAQP